MGRRVLDVTDHFSGARTMVAQVPVGGVWTLYPRIGDLFAWLSVGGIVLAVIVALTMPSAPRTGKRAAAVRIER